MKGNIPISEKDETRVSVVVIVPPVLSNVVPAELNPVGATTAPSIFIGTGISY